jgi:NitT/TauT family transport system ATP-binding protein
MGIAGPHGLLPMDEGCRMMRVSSAAELPMRPAASSVAPVIGIAALARQFVVQGRRVPVFDGLDCDIERGSFVSVIGPSGCGKSTLLKLIAGLDTPSAGRILFNGQLVSGPPKGMIYVFQQYSKSIFPWRTVLQNVAFGLGTHASLPRRAARERCLEYLHLVGLDGYRDHYPSQISGGMQQRVAIARALICEPEVLLMDEPFSAVDAMTRALLQDLLLRIWDKLPITILFVTHDVDEAVLLSSRVLSLGRAPGGIHDDLPIPLPYPRDQLETRADPQFIALRQRLFASIFQAETQSEAAC